MHSSVRCRLLSAALILSTLSACANDNPPLSWRESPLSENAKTYRINGAYPVVVGLPTDDQEVLNTHIKQLVEETMADFRRTAGAVPAAKLQGKTSTLTIGYERATLSEDLVSFALTIESSIAGSANPNVYVRTFNYDLKTRQPILIGDELGSDEGLQTLSEKAREILTDAAKTRGTYDDSVAALIAAGTEPQPENFSAFLMESGSLILLFSPYQVAPGSEGTQRISIPMNSL